MSSPLPETLPEDGDPADPDGPPTAASEGGWSIMELMVVLVITAVLMAATVGAIKSTQDGGRQSAAVGAAEQYGVAARQYADEHGNRAPVMGSTRWPTATVADGPIDPLARPGNPYYLKTRPVEAVDKGWTKLVPQGTSSPKDRIVYATAGATSSRFEFQVWVNDRYRCSVGDNVLGNADYAECSGG